MKVRPGTLPLLPVLAFVALAVVLPVGASLAASFVAAGGGRALAAALVDPLTVRAMENSLLQGVGSALLAGALGYPVGIALGRYALPGREPLRAVLLIPFLLPSLVVLVGFTELFGPSGALAAPIPGLGPLGHGLPAVLLVNVYFNASLVALLTATAIEGSPAEQEEAVTVLGGSPVRVFREVWGPLSAVGAAAGMLLTFLLSALGFAAPLVLCGPACATLEVRIWSLATTYAEPAVAGLVGILTLLLLTVPTLLYLGLLRRTRRRVAHRSRPRRRFPYRSLPGAALLAYLAAFFLALFGLLGAVLYRSVETGRGWGPGAGYASLFGSAVTDRLGLPTSAVLANSLAFASGAAILALLLAVGLGYARRQGVASGGAVEYLLFVPLLVSPILLAFGLAQFWRPLVGGAEATWALIVLSQATLALPFAAQTLGLGLDRLDPGPGEAARSLGLSGFGSYLEAELPRVRPALVGAALFAFALGLGEFTATYFLFLPPFTTLPVELLELEESRLFASTEALGGLLLLLSLGVFAAIELGGRYLEL